MKNINYYLLSILMFLSFTTQAQSQTRVCPNVDEMHERKWQFMMREVSLSPAEAYAVKPIFLNYEKSRWDFHKKNRNYFRKAGDGKKNTEINYAEMNDRAVNEEIIQAQLLRSYHLKLRKLLKPETLFHYYQAERKFKRNLLHNMPHDMPPIPPEGD